MVNALIALAVAGDVVALPETGELDALLAELRDQLVSFRRGAHPRDVGAKGINDKLPHRLPVLQGAAGLRPGKQAAQHVALRQRQLAVVGQHPGRRRVPGDHVPAGGTDNRRNGEGIEHPLQPRRHIICDRQTGLRRMAEGEYKQMFALRGGQPQTAGDPLQHLAGRRPAAPLFKPGIPGRADAGELGDLFTAQARRAPASRREAKRYRVETLAPGAEKIT